MTAVSDTTRMALLEISGLSVEFRSGDSWVRVVDELDLRVEAGETVALVGESGSGKSVTALSIARLLPTPPARYAAGTIRLDGRDVRGMSPRELQRVRGGVVGYVFQEPAAALNPVMRVGSQIRESLRWHRPEAANSAEVIRLLQRVGIPAPEARAADYPHQLSGGMQQRVMLAMAIASQPRLLVADEPTTALDVTIQAQILELLRELKDQLGMSLLLITHNLALVGDLADRVAVMYSGQIIEESPARELLRQPWHPYTRALVEAIPRLGVRTERLLAIPGTVPSPGAFPSGCRFHPRCPMAQPTCRELAPQLLEVAPGRSVRCPFVTPAGMAVVPLR